MYLRNEYATITEYNEQAGSVAEKYHFLVVADFPANFSETAAKRLQSIAVSGPRCGVFTLIHWDQRQPMPGRLRRPTNCARAASASAARATRFIHRQSADRRRRRARPRSAARAPTSPPRSSTRSARPASTPTASRCPSRRSRPPPDELWTERHDERTARSPSAAPARPSTSISPSAKARASTRSSRARPAPANPRSSTSSSPTSRSRAARSRSSSTSSTSRKASSSSATPTKRLPHARVVAIESDREFGLSVLQRVDEELKRRGDMFRKLGVQDIAGYKRAGGTEPMPRSLLHHRRVPGVLRRGRHHRADRLAALRPHRAPGPRLRHPRAARLADARRRLHAGPRHARADGHPRRAPVQRGRRLPHHGRQQLRAAPALASRRRHLQRRRRRGRRQQPVPGRLAPRRRARPAGSTKSAPSPSSSTSPRPQPDRLRGQRARRHPRERSASRRPRAHRPPPRPPPPALLARRAEFDQGPDRSRLPAARAAITCSSSASATRPRSPCSALACSRSPRSIPRGAARFVFLHSAAPGSPEPASSNSIVAACRTTSPSPAATTSPPS